MTDGLRRSDRDEGRQEGRNEGRNEGQKEKRKKSSKANRDRVDGILLLDKPAGITSNGALQQTKRLLNARKAGHTGSLDPIATGLLPLCFGESTKLSGFLLGADKGYRAVFKLGITTATGDCEGEALERREVNVSAESIDRTLPQFRGELSQIPPMYSAIKRNGQPLYKLARKGIEVEREPRQVEVKELHGKLTAADELELTMICSSGFYVRSLATDLGEVLGCGAHVQSLRRFSVGTFDVSEAITIDELASLPTAAARQQSVLPADRGLAHLPELLLTMDAAYYLCQGQTVRATETLASGLVRLYAPAAGFLGLGQVLDDGRVAPKRLFQAV